MRPIGLVPSIPVSKRAWYAAVALGVACSLAGTWGFFVEMPTNRDALNFFAYCVLPVLALVAVIVSRGHRRIPILIVLGLVDLEAALLGSGPLVALPFVVAVPLVSVAAAARFTPPQLLRLPYIAAWLASSSGVAVAVLSALPSLAPSALIVVPGFAFVDAVAMAMLWHMDAGRLRKVDASAEAEARVRDLLNGVDLFGVHVKANSQVDFINDFALRITGWHREEVIGKDWWDTFATPERREAARERYGDITAGRIAMDSPRESEILTRSGARRLIRWSHVTRHDATGKVTGVASLGEDVTSTRAGEAERRRGAELVATLVGNSPLATVVLGLDRRVQLWNAAAFAMLGWSESEILGKPIPDIVYSGDRWEVGRRFVRAVRGEAFEGELVALCRRDGEVVRARLYGGALRDLEGRSIAIAIQAVDVTSALDMEEQLREAQKMEAVGRLAGGVAHDFNNSLTAIGGFASLISTGTKEPETKEAAETILAAAKRAATLTRELLAYSRRSLLQPQTVDVNELVGTVRPMLLRLLGEDVNVVVEANVSKALVRVDPSGLERVILNLAANARDAMPGGGTLTISTDRRGPVGGADRKGSPFVVISVADTGLGIPLELHASVFDPFFTTKPVGSGTGLGLAMVKGFVVQSGGVVNLDSEPGRGTKIEILLPEVADTRKPPADAPPEAAGGDETILVVEDEPAVAAVSFQVLSRSGYRVLVADSGESAIGLLRGHSGPIDLLLVDVILPDMRGPQLVEVALTVHPEAGVLFASGYSTEAIGRRGELPAGLDLIEKPYAPDQLLARVREALDRHAAAATAKK